MNIIKKVLSSFLYRVKKHPCLFYGLRIDIIYALPRFSCNLNKAFSVLLPNTTGHVMSIAQIKRHCLWHFLKTGMTPNEFFLFGLCRTDNQQTAQSQGGYFLTDRELHKRLFCIKNAVKDEKELQDKFAFCERMKDYMNREFCMVQSEEDYSVFYSFAKDNKVVFCKPNYSCMGVGIFMAKLDSDEDIRDCFNKMISKGGKWLIEEKINQDSRMATWNTTSVNTIRYYSFLDIDGNFNVIPHVLRTGRKGSVVDNGGSGGVFAVVNPKTGIVYTDGIDETGKYYTEHPDSNQVFKGWQVPKWNELTELVEKVHREKLPNHRYVGWDWALSEKGWVLIEANWGQFLNQYVEKVGRKKEFVEYIGNNERKRG